MDPEIAIERWEVFAQGLDHPECVAFDREGVLWAGGEGGQVYRVDAEGTVEKMAELGGFVGGVALSLADEVVVCCPVRGVVKVERSGKWAVVGDLAGGEKLIAPNFGVFDSRGRYWVSDSGNWRKENGKLVRFDASWGEGKVMDGPVGYANGLALSADERWLFMVESNTNRVFRYELDGAGEVVGRSVFVEGAGRLPDGLALDEVGNLYVSCYASDEIWKVNARGEKRLFGWDPFAILLSRPTNMAFLEDTMYVANLGRTTVTRARVGVRGMELVNRRGKK